MTITEKIFELVDRHSGGVKFIELMTELYGEIVDGNVEDWDDAKVPKNFPDILEAQLKQMSDLSILEYGMQLGPKLERVKLFVYRPLKDGTERENVENKESEVQNETVR